MKIGSRIAAALICLASLLSEGAAALHRSTKKTRQIPPALLFLPQRRGYRIGVERTLAGMVCS
jgi:hypothetical protein